MKKLLAIVVLGLLLSGNAYSNSGIDDFNLWLLQNGHTQYLEINENYEECKDCTSSWATTSCYEEDGKPKKQCVLDGDQGFSETGGFKWSANGKYKNNLDIKITKYKNNLDYDSNPNKDTLIYYLWNYSYKTRKELKELKSTNNSYDFKINLIEDKFVKKQMKTKGILSYLYYQDDEVLIDEFSPKERLGEFLNNETKFYSMSMSKSITSYILGHAICEGYIDGVDTKLNDWPILKNSLYYDQKLINLLNMAAGDQKYINEYKKGRTGHPLADLNYDYEANSISNTINLFFQGSEKSKNRYNYNGFITQIILNYIKFKTGENYEKLFSDIFNNKVKIKNSILFGKLDFIEENGNGHPNISATRYDYLRIAKAIMDDYQNQTCVGQYLKEIHERRIPKRYNKNKNEPKFNRTKSYGGQFHMDYPGLIDKVIFGMGGYGGQAILIDMENSRIVVLNSLHYNKEKYRYNFKKLLIDPIKKGK